MLGIEHRSLETDRIDDHPEPLDTLFGGGQDIQIAEAKDAAEHRLREHSIVDLLKRTVRGALVEDTLGLDDTAVGQDELRVHVVQRRPQQERQAADRKGCRQKE